MSGRVIVVGGGLAGLNCCLTLQARGVDFVLLEAAESVGGRIRTDRVDGFQIDRGFQVFLTAYPEARGALNYEDLNLRPLHAGALVRFGGKFHRMSDPWRHPLDAIRGAFSPVGSIADKLRIGRLRSRLRRTSLDQIEQAPELTTIGALRREGFSGSIIERFFRPFLGGVFLETDLNTTSHKFEFVFKMFSMGDTALPAAGMEAIPRQLASRLPAERVRTSCRVQTVRSDGVTLVSGENIAARSVVVATDRNDALKLLGPESAVSWNSTTCLYYAAEKPPVREPILVLNSESEGPVNNLVVLDQVAPEYAPPGASLVSVTVVGVPDCDDHSLDHDVRSQLKGWFGKQVQAWNRLRVYRLQRALPAQSAGRREELPAIPLSHRIYCCGDHLELASINGALLSGRRTAEAVLRDF